VILPGTPLRLLASLKLRGTLRKQLRRLRRPSGVLFALIGLVLTVGWLAMLAMGRQSDLGSGLEGDALLTAIELGCLVLVLMTLAGSLSHRGLYLPKEEIELLLAAPLARSELVRYRLLTGTARAAFGGIVIALMIGGRMPRALFGSLGAFLATLLLPVLGQGVSLLAGDAENRLWARVSRLPMRALSVVLALAVVGFAMAMVTGARWGPILREVGLSGGLSGLLANPWLRAVARPFEPWARMIAAQDAQQFLLWAGVCTLLWALAFELVARLPVDFRELSLATSADVARRLSRRRRGAGASSTEASRRSAGWRVPWLFGRRAFGALAWRKSCAILRKARGTFVTSAVILAVLTLFTAGMEPERDAEAALRGSSLIALLGTLYLCAGLRFDFREDLEHMEVVKSWPVPPRRVFLATLLPEVVLVSLLLAAAIGARALFTQSFHPGVLLIVAALPLAVLAWVAVDNAVFLYAPVRYTPGEEGALHHAGRAMAVMLLRLVVFGAAAAGMVGVGFAGWWIARELAGADAGSAAAVAVGLGAATLLAEDLVLVAIGGRMLGRFDVARDRG
jgi:hypothetical protein